MGNGALETDRAESRADGGISLSICIATFGRGAFIRETLEALLAQADDRVEIVVVDGASPDNTKQVVTALQATSPGIVYRREPVNAGVDRDFDKAVGYASGEYCWLMSDDDLPAGGALQTVLRSLADKPDLVVVNAEIRDKHFATVLKASQLDLDSDRIFNSAEHEQLFAATAGYLSFIGGVVIRRDVWLARDREPYFGSLFIHMGVIFQAPGLRTKVIVRPLVQVRYGNALWTARGFEIWTHKWPDLVWSFQHFSQDTRRGISVRCPAKSLKTLLWYRAIGAYGPAEHRALLAGGRPCHPLARVVAHLPAAGVNAALTLYCIASRHRDSRVKLYDLLGAACALPLSRWLARRSLFPETEK